MKEIKCYGCGSVIQSEDEHHIGYVPKNALEKDHVLCKRCFRLKHYHDLQDSNLTKDDFLNILQTIGEKDGLIVYIIDLFDFNGSLISGLNRHLNSDNILIVGNKRDVLPKNINDNKIINWLQYQLKAQGVQYQELVLTSSKNNYNLDALISLIDSYRNHKDVYVVGVTNVGKSSLINSLLKAYSDTTHFITTSEFPGTTLDLIEIPLDEQSSIYDTPGIINEHQMAHIVKPDNLKDILPNGELKAINYQLNSKQSLYISGLVRYDYLEGDKATFTCYFPKNLKIHRCKLENADRLYNNHNTLEIEVPGYEDVSEFTRHTFNIPDEKVDIVVSGLGFITINSRKGNIEVRAPKGIGVFIRKALI